jgi:hypothetical protein
MPELTSWKRNVKSEDAKSKKKTGYEPSHEKADDNTTEMSIGGHEVLRGLVAIQPMTVVEGRNTTTRWVTATAAIAPIGTTIGRGMEEGEGDIGDHDQHVPLEMGLLLGGRFAGFVINKSSFGNSHCHAHHEKQPFKDESL